MSAIGWLSKPPMTWPMNAPRGDWGRSLLLGDGWYALVLRRVRRMGDLNMMDSSLIRTTFASAATHRANIVSGSATRSGLVTPPVWAGLNRRILPADAAQGAAPARGAAGWRAGSADRSCAGEGRYCPVAGV